MASAPSGCVRPWPQFDSPWRGRAGARLAAVLGVSVSRSTVLRLVGALPEPEVPAPRVVGVDEYATRKGRQYGTVLVDVETRRPIDAGSWADSRFGDRHFTFWETPDGTPVSMTATTSMVSGMIRVDPVCTPAHLRGRGYAGAVTVEVSRTAPAAGATDVVLFTDPANPTSNALYQRIGYAHVADFAGYRFSYGAPEAGWEHDRRKTHLPSGS